MITGMSEMKNPRNSYIKSLFWINALNTRIKSFTSASILRNQKKRSNCNYELSEKISMKQKKKQSVKPKYSSF